MIGLCLGELPLGYFVLSTVHHAGRGSLSSKPWNKAVGFRKLTKYCDSFRFLELFCVCFYWEGTLFIWVRLYDNYIGIFCFMRAVHFAAASIKSYGLTRLTKCGTIFTINRVPGIKYYALS